MNNFKLISLTTLLSVSQITLAEDDPFNLAFEDLLGIEITSVSKQSQPLSNAPAAIYVITNEDIIRSGATSIPQALRGVPGLHVAQIDSQKWAVSSRGFNGRYNNKLLVMMDGRTLYSPKFSGVYWEIQDTLMADIERIEIIRGPSAAMWGANAVNGVINITTKHSAETLGGYAELGAGDYEQAFAGFRYGGELADNTMARAYAKGFKRDSLEHHSQDINPLAHSQMIGVDIDNDWHNLQAGGRMDMQIDLTASLIVTADVYKSEMQHVTQTPSLIAPFYSEINSDSFDSRGWNILGKYTKAVSASSEYSFQAYYDYVRRDETLFDFSTNTLDFDFQYQFNLDRTHNFIWGLGYRHISDKINPNAIIDSLSTSSNTNLWSAFIRDEIQLIENELWLTLASRFEHNSYTDFEVQPNIRLMWQLNEQHKLWSSISYAVRTPARAESSLSVNSFNIPPNLPINPFITKVLINGNDNYESEELLSYEIGYRFIPSNNISFDSVLFYNDYDKLRSVSIGNIDLSNVPSYLTLPTFYSNEQDGYNYGFELSSQWLASDSLKFKFNYAYTHSEFVQNSGSGAGQSQNTDTPEHIASLQADWNIAKNLSLDMTYRYVDTVEILDSINFSTKQLDSYHGVDIGLHWAVTPTISIEAFGKNLLNSSHVEYESEAFQLPNRVEPSYYGKVTLNF